MPGHSVNIYFFKVSAGKGGHQKLKLLVKVPNKIWRDDVTIKINVDTVKF